MGMLLLPMAERCDIYTWKMERWQMWHLHLDCAFKKWNGFLNCWLPVTNRHLQCSICVAHSSSDWHSKGRVLIKVYTDDEHFIAYLLVLTPVQLQGQMQEGYLLKFKPCLSSSRMLVLHYKSSKWDPLSKPIWCSWWIQAHFCCSSVLGTLQAVLQDTISRPVNVEGFSSQEIFTES